MRFPNTADSFFRYGQVARKKYLCGLCPTDFCYPKWKMWEQYSYCILICFWIYSKAADHEQISTKARDTSRTCCKLTVVSAALLPDGSGAARLHIGLIGSFNARLPRHTPIACDGFITLGLWLSVSIRSRLSSLTSHLRYVKPEMLSLALRVIAHLWAGTAHHPTIGNNVTPDPIFNCQVSVWLLLVHFRSPLCSIVVI